ncbi:hypothetical protein C7S15_8794 [Burkholderia cepacia]|nr:hypothetical protein [Burkholderia cepacia]
MGSRSGRHVTGLRVGSRDGSCGDGRRNPRAAPRACADVGMGIAGRALRNGTSRHARYGIITREKTS